MIQSVGELVMPQAMIQPVYKQVNNEPLVSQSVCPSLSK